MPDDIDRPESRTLSETVLVRMSAHLKKALDARANRDRTSAAGVLRRLAAQDCQIANAADLRMTAPRRTRRQIDKDANELQRLERYMTNCALRLKEVADESHKLYVLDSIKAQELRQITETTLAELKKLSTDITSLIKPKQQHT